MRSHAPGSTLAARAASMTVMGIALAAVAAAGVVALGGGGAGTGQAAAAVPPACPGREAPAPGASGLAGPAHGGTTFYVRPDGGSGTQCNGRANTGYPGSGSALDCAWNSPQVALPRSGEARIAGGDTLVIGSGTYPLDSILQPVPGGSASARTRILGDTAAGGPPRLVGTGGIHRVLNLEGSSHVEIGHLAITDASDCVHNHSDPRVACGPGDDWARVGIYARDSRNVWIHDVDIHGLAARGFQAGALADWTIERVRILRNGSAGWDGNVGDHGANSGRIVMRDIEIGWNGCGERVATGEAWACWGQQSGGYGDGLGTTATGGQWLIEDAFIHHNTADGLDLLYMDGADATSVTLRRVLAMANAGNQVKVSGNALVENSVIVGHCRFFAGRDFMADGDHCRAHGAALLLRPTGNDTVIVRHNTIAGEGESLIGIASRNLSDRLQFLGNIGVGFPTFPDGTRPPFFAGGRADNATVSGNLAWNVDGCPPGVHCGRPGEVDARPGAFDPDRFAGTTGAGHAAGGPCAGPRLPRPRPPGPPAGVPAAGP